MKIVSARAAYNLFTGTLYRFDRELFPHADSRESGKFIAKWRIRNE